MTFEQLIVRWNGEKIDGAKARFAERLGVQMSSVSQWTTGRYAPSEDTKKKISKLLSITTEELEKSLEKTKALRLKEKQETYSAGPGGVQHIPVNLRHLENNLENAILPAGLIPVLGVVSAETFKFSFQSIPDEYIPAPCPPGHQCFGLKVRGACMEPKVSDGEYIIVAKTDYVDNGQVAVVGMGDDCTLKRVFLHKDHIELKPENPKFKSIKKQPSEIRIIGRATGKFSKW